MSDIESMDISKRPLFNFNSDSMLSVQPQMKKKPVFLMGQEENSDKAKVKVDSELNIKSTHGAKKETKNQSDLFDIIIPMPK